MSGGSFPTADRVGRREEAAGGSRVRAAGKAASKVAMDPIVTLWPKEKLSPVTSCGADKRNYSYAAPKHLFLGAKMMHRAVQEDGHTTVVVFQKI